MITSWAIGGLIALISAIVSATGVWFFVRNGKRQVSRELAVVKQEKEQITEKYSLAREDLAAAQQRATRTADLENQVGSLQKKLSETEAEKARIEERLSNTETLAKTQIELFDKLAEQTKINFQAIASEVVQGNSKVFLENASLTLNPFTETFARYEKLLKQMDGDRQKEFGGISTELANVRSQLELGQTITTRLVNALRAAPKTRGRWGEESLKRAMELAGMIQHCDFELEKSYKKLDETLRPDAVLHLAGERHIIVDAKAPFSAFLDAVEAETDEQREAHLTKHAAQLRERMQSLASRAYWEKLDGTPDCVVMFVPGENFFSAAVERDSSLFDDAISKGVLIATPTTFIALAKAIAYGWRQQKLAESAFQIAQLGRDLYQRLSVMGGHLVSMGTGLKRSVEDYNKLVGSVEGNVMPQARKFQELGIEGTSKVIATIEPLDADVRDVRPGRDLALSETPRLHAIVEKP
jgi:DNA recombination protein RmuC